MKYVFISVNQHASGAPLEKGATPFLLLIERLGVAIKQALNESRKYAIFLRMKKEVVVIGH
jgi:hypothetical protein